MLKAAILIIALQH